MLLRHQGMWSSHLRLSRWAFPSKEFARLLERLSTTQLHSSFCHFFLLRRQIFYFLLSYILHFERLTGCWNSTVNRQFPPTTEPSLCSESEMLTRNWLKWGYVGCCFAAFGDRFESNGISSKNKNWKFVLLFANEGHKFSTTHTWLRDCQRGWRAVKDRYYQGHHLESSALQVLDVSHIRCLVAFPILLLR